MTTLLTRFWSWLVTNDNDRKLAELHDLIEMDSVTYLFISRPENRGHDPVFWDEVFGTNH